MNITYLVLPILVQIITVVSIVVISWYFIRLDILKYFKGANSSNTKVAETDLKAAAGTPDQHNLLTLRLQAHERLIVFTDRLNPANLFLRLHQPGISAKELHSLILNEIRLEYQHNVTQQLYVSSDNWRILSKLKEDTLAMINNAIAGLPADASGVDLSRIVLEHMAGIKENPYELTLELIKRDIHQLF